VCGLLVCTWREEDHLSGTDGRVESEAAVDQIQVVVDGLRDPGDGNVELPLERLESDLVGRAVRAVSAANVKLSIT